LFLKAPQNFHSWQTPLNIDPLHIKQHINTFDANPHTTVHNSSAQDINTSNSSSFLQITATR
jgi:hypothetical protein